MKKIFEEKIKDNIFYLLALQRKITSIIGEEFKFENGKKYLFGSFVIYNLEDYIVLLDNITKKVAIIDIQNSEEKFLEELRNI